MLLPNDYVRAARYLVDRYGPNALPRAEKRAEALRGEGDERLYPLWNVLTATIAQITQADGSRISA